MAFCKDCHRTYMSHHKGHNRCSGYNEKDKQVQALVQSRQETALEVRDLVQKESQKGQAPSTGALLSKATLSR